MSRAIAINVGANTNLPGFRGPIHADGSFEYVPIPEREPTRVPPPTYADLGLNIEIPPDVRDVPVHLDPEFAEYGACSTYTYGDPHGVKAGPLAELRPDDYLLFYATLSTHAPAKSAEWIAPDWGAYLIGEFRVERAVTGEEYRSLSKTERERFATNAHVKREPFDAKVLVAGDPDTSRLYDRAIPLSVPTAGATANWLVTDLSNDSGQGPWWRRRLWFDEEASERLRAIVEAGPSAVLNRI